MSATDELRRLLDELGVEYEADERNAITKWSTYYGAFVFFARQREGKLLVETTVATEHSVILTPEQAIAATLGDDAKPCPWCGNDMQEGHRDGHVWYRDDSDYIQGMKRSIDALQKAHATLGGGKLTAEQVRVIIERHFSRVAVLDDGKPVEWRDDWVCKVGIDYKGIADELNATLGGGECGAKVVRA